MEKHKKLQESGTFSFLSERFLSFGQVNKLVAPERFWSYTRIETGTYRTTLSTKYILPRESQAQPCLSISTKIFLPLYAHFNKAQLLDGGGSHNVDRKVRILKEKQHTPP